MPSTYPWYYASLLFGVNHGLDSNPDSNPKLTGVKKRIHGDVFLTLATMSEATTNLQNDDVRREVYVRRHRGNRRRRNTERGTWSSMMRHV